MAALLAYVPPTQVLFGSDSPYMQHADNIQMLQDRKLKPEVWKAITQDNARRLMPGLKA
jgi:predicted TIM-barrel fold metal-dependent hydrolase